MKESELQKIEETFPQLIDVSINKKYVSFACSLHPFKRETIHIASLLRRRCACRACSDLTKPSITFNKSGKPESTKLIKSLQQLFDNKFDYSQFMATTTTERSTIICPQHGKQHISITDHVLNTGAKGCVSCAELSDKSINSKGGANIALDDDWMTSANDIFSTFGGDIGTRKRS